MQRQFAITFNAETGVAQALRKYCEQNGIPINRFIVETVSERLRDMDIHSLSIAEIEEIEKWQKIESAWDL